MLDLTQCQKPGKRMTFRGIRTTKFRHVFGAPAKKEKCFENVRITRNAHESNYCAVNPKFLGLVVEVGGGGSFIVLQIDKTGRVDHNVCKVIFIYKNAQNNFENRFRRSGINKCAMHCSIVQP